MNSTTERLAPTAMLDLLDHATGVARRESVLDAVLEDARSAQELRLMLALEASAEQLAADVAKPAVGAWVRLGAPVAAAALLLLAWPQQIRHGNGLQESVASITMITQSDELLTGSFEAGSDRAFGGGFE